MALIYVSRYGVTGYLHENVDILRTDEILTITIHILTNFRYKPA